VEPGPFDPAPEQQCSPISRLFGGCIDSGSIVPPGIDPATGNVVTYAIEAQAMTDVARERITVHPLATSCIFVRIYAYDDSPGHTRLDYADSPPFQWHDPEADCSQFAATPAAPATASNEVSSAAERMEGIA
jgi:hypothetical protein